MPENRYKIMYQCLICNSEMKKTERVTYTDHYCNKYDDHHFSWRIKDHRMTKLRIRFGDRLDERLHLKLHYDEGYSEVWTKSKSISRLRIDEIIVPDFSDLEQLKNKIRTLLVFG